MLKIIPLLPENLDQVIAIEQKAHISPWAINLFKDNMGRAYTNLALLLDDKVIGFAICHVMLEEATLLNIAIDPNQQKKGYGKKILENLIDRLIEKNITSLWLEVRKSNSMAINLYTHLGFNQIYIRKEYYPTKSRNIREDALVMALHL